MTKILYLTFFESVTHNGIYETQVKELLCKLASKDEHPLRISHIAFLPAAEIGKRDVVAPFLSGSREHADLEKLYAEHGVRAKICFLPIVVLKRWKSNPPLVLSAALLVVAFSTLLLSFVRQRPHIIHCRSYIATLLAVLIKKLYPGTKVVFDARGFWPEEGVVIGSWKQDSFSFRFWKRVERSLFRWSDMVVALSEPFADRVLTIAPEAQCAVIYTSADLNRFQNPRQYRQQKRLELGFEDKLVFAYNGSLNAWHDSLLLAQVFRTIHGEFKNAVLLVLTGFSREKLDEAFRKEGLASGDYTVVAARPSEMPALLAAADYGLAPLKEIKEGTAMAVVARTMIGTKIAEYLACGLPVIVNRNVGGMKSLMQRYRIGGTFDVGHLEEVPYLVQQMQAHYDQYQRDCRIVASSCFSLDQVAGAYRELYSELIFGSPNEKPEAETVKTA